MSPKQADKKEQEEFINQILADTDDYIDQIPDKGLIGVHYIPDQGANYNALTGTPFNYATDSYLERNRKEMGFKELRWIFLKDMAKNKLKFKHPAMKNKVLVVSTFNSASTDLRSKITSDYIVNVDLIEGIKPVNTKLKESTQSLIKAISKDLNLNVSINDGYIPRFNNQKNTIFMPSLDRFHDQDMYDEVFLHEAVHATGAKHRLNRDCFINYAQSHKIKAQEEIVAEIGAILLCQDLGLKYKKDNSLYYISSFHNEPKNYDKEKLKKNILQTTTYISTQPNIKKLIQQQKQTKRKNYDKDYDNYL